MIQNELLTHVADIVSAHVSYNAVSPGDVAGLIQSVHGTLAKLGARDEPVEDTRSPAISIRSSVKPGAITCLECGAKLKIIKRHLQVDHGLTPAEYRDRWKLPSNYPMVAPEYAAKRKELALTIGLGRKPKADTSAADASASAPLKSKRKSSSPKSTVAAGVEQKDVKPKSSRRKKPDAAPAGDAAAEPAGSE